MTRRGFISALLATAAVLPRVTPKPLVFGLCYNTADALHWGMVTRNAEIARAFGVLASLPLKVYETHSGRSIGDDPPWSAADYQRSVIDRQLATLACWNEQLRGTGMHVPWIETYGVDLAREPDQQSFVVI